MRYSPLRPRTTGRQHVDAGALGQRQHAVDHLRHGLALDRQAGGGRVGHADARPQQPHVVVDLGDGADRRARVLRGGLLLDRDGGRQAVDLVDVRLLHHLQELPGVGRQRLDVAALALGVDGVEGERGFARAGQAGEHHQLVARDLDVDVLEVVLARAADRDHAAVDARRFAAANAGPARRLLFEQIVHGIPMDSGAGSAAERRSDVRNVVRTSAVSPVARCREHVDAIVDDALRPNRRKGRRAAGPAFRRSDRGRGSELVVQAAAHDVGRERHVGRIAAGAGRVAGHLAEIDVEIFELGRPVVDEGVFDAGADRPADPGRPG